MPSEKVDTDEVIHSAGNTGKYQILQGLFCTLACLAGAFPALSFVFLGYIPEHHCSALPNTTDWSTWNIESEFIEDIQYRKCHIDITCNKSGVISHHQLSCINGYEYDVHRDVSIVSEGIGIGSYSMFVELLTPDIRIYCGLLDSIAWSLSTMSMAPVAYLTRNYSWRTFQLATLISFIHVPFLLCMMSESLRWLLANNKYKSAEKVIQRMCKMNKTSFEKTKLVLQQEISKVQQSKQDVNLQYLKHAVQSESDIVKEDIAKCLDSEKHNFNSSKPEELYDEKDAEKEKIALLVDSDETPPYAEEEQLESKEPDHYTVLDVFKHMDVLKMSTILWFIWAVHAMTYYGLYLTSSSMSGNRFLNYFLNALVEIPAYITMFFALKRKGRREVIMLFSFLSGFFLLISFIFLATLGDSSIGGILSNLFSLLGKFSVSGSFMVVYMYTPEIYPTNLRNAGLGMASALGRFGGMVAPYSSLLSEIAVWGPGVVFTVCCVLASILMYFLPETKGRSLPTTLQEMRDLKHKHMKSVEIIIPEVKK